MSDDTPSLVMPGSELWQWAQATTAVAALLGRLRARRASEGRLAFSDGEQAARQHELRQRPPIRLMTEAELADWSRSVPSGVLAARADEPLTLWAARLGNSGDWGLEARAWAGGAPVASARVVCRDAADVLALSRHLRERPTAAAVQELHALARPAERGTSVLSELEWAAALRAHLPADVAERVIVTNPAHRHHRAWRELHGLASEEVTRVGADPDRLAALVARGPRWRGDVRNPPALAHWALTEARSSPAYERTVATRPASAAAPTADRMRLTDVHDPQQAVLWASGLRATDALHRIEAKQGFGRWGSQVDATLAGTVPDLADTRHAADPAVTAELDALYPTVHPDHTPATAPGPRDGHARAPRPLPGERPATLPHTHAAGLAPGRVTTR